MSLAMRNKFAQQYANNYVETSVTEASPHKLVSLLYDAALKNLAVTKVFIERKDMEKKAFHINKVISILYHLRSGLDMEAGGDVAANLWSLYDYMVRRTFEASSKNNLAIIDEVSALIKDISDAWKQMPSEYQTLTQDQLKRMKAGQ